MRFDTALGGLCPKLCKYVGQKEDIFFWHRSGLWIWLYSAQHGKYTLQNLLVWQTLAVVCQALPSSLLAQRWVQGAKHTILLQKPKPRLHHSKDEGQQNGYIEMTLSSSESGHWASESHLLCWRKETELFPLCLPLLFLQNQLCSGRAQQPSLPCESRGLWTFPNWGMSLCPEWLCAHAVSYSCVVLLQRRDRRGVQQKQHLAPGNLFMSSGGDWAKEKMTWSPQVSSWAFSLGREAWRVVFNMWFEICCWH